MTGHDDYLNEEGVAVIFEGDDQDDEEDEEDLDVVRVSGRLYSPPRCQRVTENRRCLARAVRRCADAQLPRWRRLTHATFVSPLL